MAYEEKIERISRDAAADLSSYQYYFVDSASNVVTSNAGGDALGILQNDPVSGEAASIAIGGVSKVALGATVAAGAEVAIDAAGKAVTAVSTNIVLGTCLVGGDAGEIGCMTIDKNGVKA